MPFSITKTPKVIKYLLSGGTAFSLEYLLFLILYYLLSVDEAVANALAFTAGFATSFLLNKYWVFDGAQKKALSKQVIFYCILAIANLILSSTLITLLISYSLPAYIAKILLIILVATWNYTLFNRLIFRSQ